ncbi:hypothetical protein [Phytoactinopolyspora endophytica]|uniref:hypothetical protein n=1 Tax=Phytoactinopolyspora endophytica TaxID=1642495 RepID=UPI00101DA67B|nr:hypothetical protein [Phytoactinopolyspora endophytica]
MGRADELREYYDNTDTSVDLEKAVHEPADTRPSARMTTFAIRLPVPVLHRVREIAAESDTTTSALLRRWIDSGIREYDDSDDRVVSVDDLVDFIGRASRRSDVATHRSGPVKKGRRTRTRAQ